MKKGVGITMSTSYANYEWYLNKDLGAYSGKWVAIIDKEVVASETDVEKLINEVKLKYPNKKPLITKVKNWISIL